MEKGKFIVIEGGEGAGKGACIQYLKEKLAHLKEFGVYENDVAYNTIFTREPGGTEISEQIRNILMHKSNTKTTALTELFLFCAARVQHVDELVKPTLAQGKHVISDRFDVSTKAYQIYGRKRLDLLEEFNELNDIAKDGVEPDVIIYLDVEPEIGLLRKNKSKDGLSTRFDEEKFEFHELVRGGYISQYEKAREGNCPVWHLIKTTHMSEQEVKDKVWNITKQILNINFN